MTAVFSLGNQQLPPNLAKIALSICDEADVTHSEFFYKWEAWALNNNKQSDLPTESDLNHFAEHIRQLQQPSTKPSITPTKSSTRKSLFYEPTPAPVKLSIDDFFTYIENEDQDEKDTNREAHKDENILIDDPDEKHALSPVDTKPVTEMEIDSAPSKQKVTQPIPSILYNADDDVIRRPLNLPGDDQPDKQYAERDGVGRIEVTHNPDISISRRKKNSKILLTSFIGDTKDAIPKYMDDDANTRVENVRNHVQQLGADILARQQRADGEDAPPISCDAFADASPQRVRLIGRVRVELDETDGVLAGRINPNAVLLEGEDGQLVKMDLSRLREARTPVFLAPGMVVVVEGVKHNRGIIDVYSLYDNAMPQPALIEEQEQRRLGIKTEDTEEQNEQNTVVQKTENETTDDLNTTNEAKDEQMEEDTDEIMPDLKTTEDDQPYANVVVAAGPFTTSSNLKFEPLDELLTMVERRNPDVLVLIGPFVDERHSKIGTSTPESFEDIFEQRILERIVRTATSSGVEVAIIPSLHDVHHEFVCPQPSFRWGDRSSRSSAVHLLGNPAILELSTGSGSNQWRASIGVTSLPTIQDLSGDCVCWGRTDRFSAIVSHMLRQRSFYPSFPPSRAVPLDSSLLNRLQIPQMDTTSTVDVLISPSVLKTFVKCVDGGAVAINPGLLCRGSIGGTYTEVSIPLHRADRPRPLNMNENRLQASIVRL